MRERDRQTDRETERERERKRVKKTECGLDFEHADWGQLA